MLYSFIRRTVEISNFSWGKYKKEDNKFNPGWIYKCEFTTHSVGLRKLPLPFSISPSNLLTNLWL